MEGHRLDDFDSRCFCGSDLPYGVCCQPFHEYKKNPVTAESLMRSRYTAYALQNDSYLLDTWVLEKKPLSIDFSNEEAEWIRLEIVKTKKGRDRDVKGVVEFKAYYRLNNEEYVMNEVSRFTKLSGRWLYQDGIVKSVVKVDE